MEKTFDLPLPPACTKNQIPEKALGRLQTTSSATYVTHDVSNSHMYMFKKAPLNQNVHHMATFQALQTPYNELTRPLNPGSQSTEFRSNYNCNQNSPELREKLKTVQQGFDAKLSNIDRSRKTQLNKPLAVPDASEPYLSTTNKVHRRFTKGDVSGYAKKDICTLWDYEQMPRAWGHGPKEGATPLPREPLNGPMIDRSLFPTATKIYRYPRSLNPIEGAKVSETTDKFRAPPKDNTRRESRWKQKSTPFQELEKKYVEEAEAFDRWDVPKMYVTTNMDYGRPMNKYIYA
eukprot:Colp12_sorted_trinity150504_noHs@22258